MNIAIRADASIRRGSGHVMRCLTLAEALRREGDTVRFLCRDDPGHLGEEIVRRGFALTLLPLEEVAVCQAMLAEGVDGLIVDHYGLDIHWERAMRSYARVLMVIDDLDDRAHDCDLLLNQNVLTSSPLAGEGWGGGEDRRRSQLLLGPRYALLREEFERTDRRQRPGRLAHLLIFFGGTDAPNLTERVLEQLAPLSPPLTADVVIGMGNPHQERIAARCQASDGRWTLHVQTDRMAELMAQADLALGAGGSSHWERCRMGLPALVITLAENQIAVTRQLDQQGACWWLGEGATLRPEIVGETLRALLVDPMPLVTMSAAAQQIVPGGGTAKVVNELKQLWLSKLAGA